MVFVVARVAPPLHLMRRTAPCLNPVWSRHLSCLPRWPSPACCSPAVVLATTRRPARPPPPASTPARTPSRWARCNSLSGTMAISEVTVRDSIKLGDRRDQRRGRRAGQEDRDRRRGRRLRARPVRREGREADQQRLCRSGVRRLDLVEPQGHAAGVREQRTRCSTTPCSTRAWSDSKNIFYTGATTNQQIIPALDYLKEKGVKSLYLVGSDYVFPQTANRDHQGLRGGQRHRDQGRGLHAAGLHRLLHHRQQGPRRRGRRGVQHAQRRLQRRVLPRVHQRRA